MIEISLNKVNKNYGYEYILKDFSMEIKTGEKIALIGNNGSGKTTALKLIYGLETPDSGSINIRKGNKIGYLCQIPGKEKDDIKAKEVYLRGVEEILNLEKRIDDFISTMTSKDKSIKELSNLQEEFRTKGGYQINEKINKIKNGFKLTDELLNTPYNSLSGGEKTIINLASLILSEPDILLLDEPTNHLDIETLEWFEEYLKNYKGSVLIVSHDRYFLDKVVSKVIYINSGKEDVYHGNYSYYVEESEKRLIHEFQNYKNQQKQIKAMEEAIERLKEWGRKSDNPIFFRRAESIQKRLDKLEIIDKPKTKKDIPVKFNESSRSGNIVIDIKDLALSIANKTLLEKSKLEIRYKERVCLLGKNGSGKTTLIKEILANKNRNIKIGSNIIIGYIPQEIIFDNEELTIYEHMRKIFIGDEANLRSKLHQFYFGNETISKKLKTLSGGEKVRIKLLELILSNANFLILDEPTNHIDIETREILEKSLLEFSGTILFISHDRYFINEIATTVVRIEDKKLVTYLGNYDDIKNKFKIEENKKENIKKETIIINGSNRLKEFLKDSKIEEITNTKNKKTYKIQKKSKIFYLKIADHLSKESIRLEYLQNKINIPEKIFYEKYNNKSYLLTKSIRGINLTNEYYLKNKEEAMEIIIEAFNSIYNIDYSDCILDETIDQKIKYIEENINNINKNYLNELLTKFHTIDSIIKYLKGNKPKHIIGFTHGNMILENIISEEGKFKGLIDIKNAGLSDIYYDLVTCEESIEKHYGKEYANLFYEKLGIEKDEYKSEYYKVLNSLFNSSN